VIEHKEMKLEHRRKTPHWPPLLSGASSFFFFAPSSFSVPQMRR
jgi:hypothetical protein